MSFHSSTKPSILRLNSDSSKNTLLCGDHEKVSIKIPSDKQLIGLNAWFLNENLKIFDQIASLYAVLSRLLADFSQLRNKLSNSTVCHKCLCFCSVERTGKEFEVNCNCWAYATFELSITPVLWIYCSCVLWTRHKNKFSQDVFDFVEFFFKCF